MILNGALAELAPRLAVEPPAVWIGRATAGEYFQGYWPELDLLGWTTKLNRSTMRGPARAHQLNSHNTSPMTLMDLH